MRGVSNVRVLVGNDGWQVGGSCAAPYDRLSGLGVFRAKKTGAQVSALLNYISYERWVLNCEHLRVYIAYIAQYWHQRLLYSPIGLVLQLFVCSRVIF